MEVKRGYEDSNIQTKIKKCREKERPKGPDSVREIFRRVVIYLDGERNQEHIGDRDNPRGH
jgi:hypothetical protein